MKRLLNKSLPTEIKTIVTYQSERLVTKFKLKGKTKFYPHNNLVFTVSVQMTHVLKIAFAKQIKELRKELLTTANVTKICIC